MKKLQIEELNRKTLDEFREAGKYPVRVILDNVRSQNNVGSIFRTCDAFLLEGIILCGITANPPHREISKTALGATESVSWEYTEKTTDAVKAMREQGYRIMAVEQTEGSRLLHEIGIIPGEKYALVFGHEIHGVAQEVIDLCDGAIEIPQHGTKHSLNIAVSTGIVLWEFFKFYQEEGCRL